MSSRGLESAGDAFGQRRGVAGEEIYRSLVLPLADEGRGVTDPLEPLFELTLFTGHPRGECSRRLP